MFVLIHCQGSGVGFGHNLWIEAFLAGSGLLPARSVSQRRSALTPGYVTRCRHMRLGRVPEYVRGEAEGPPSRYRFHDV